MNYYLVITVKWPMKNLVLLNLHYKSLHQISPITIQNMHYKNQQVLVQVANHKQGNKFLLQQVKVCNQKQCHKQVAKESYLIGCLVKNLPWVKRWNQTVCSDNKWLYLTFLFISQTRTWISRVICHGLFFIFLFFELRWGMIVCFVDIGGIVDHHCSQRLDQFMKPVLWLRGSVITAPLIYFKVYNGDIIMLHVLPEKTEDEKIWLIWFDLCLFSSTFSNISAI